MNTAQFDKFAEALEQISARYGARFAGQTRQTRSLGLLDEIIAESSTIVAALRAVPEADRAAVSARFAEVLEIAADNLKLYRGERAAIVEAKAAGPDFEEAARLASSANFIFARYVRHFAGQSRQTRDLGLLDEMLDELKHIKRRLGDLSTRTAAIAIERDRKVVSDTLSFYESERQEIQKAQLAGTLEEQSDALAQRANGQFRVYTVHFAGQSRATRRPQLLQRMINNLKQIRDRMAELKKRGLASENNNSNIGVVENNVRLYERELAEIRKERQQIPLVDLMGMLGGAANEIFEEYRQTFGGKSRAQVNLEALGGLCDRLAEVARQMSDMQRTERNEQNAANLNIVMDNLSSFENEYEQVRTQQQSPPAQQS